MADEQEGTSPDETAATTGGPESRTRRSMPRRRTALAEPEKASGGSSAARKATRSGDAALAAAEAPGRTGPVQFVRESVAELRKVIWPTPWQWQQYFIVVLVFVLFIIAFVSLIDLGLATAIIRAFG